MAYQLCNLIKITKTDSGLKTGRIYGVCIISKESIKKLGHENMNII